MNLRDRNGRSLRAGDLVQVPDPDHARGDPWNHSFQGTVHFQTEHSRRLVVKDQDDCSWEVEADRLEILD